jgi:stage III sporulation protein AA
MLITASGTKMLRQTVTEEDMKFCINAASGYSPWAAATVGKGYLTAAGGHRIGLCGEAVIKDGHLETIRRLRSLCIRVARDFPGIGRTIPVANSLLIIGPPGWGKTTLLRDLIRCRSEQGIQIGTVDERGELFPSDAFGAGPCTDILSGCSKAEGIPILLRTMGPQCIAVDEITQQEDCLALEQAVGCGTTLLATIHGGNVSDLRRRPVYRTLLDAKLFDAAIVMQADKSWRMERMN